MNHPTIYITDADAAKLRKMIRENHIPGQRRTIYLESLAGELDRAVVTDARHIPADVITMNSTARLLDLDSGEEMTCTLVFPEQADPLQGRISILAPIGTGMLGFRTGDEFEWQTPAGLSRIRVEEVLYQPEAAGDEG